MSYLYMIINDFKKANFVMDLLFRIMCEAKNRYNLLQLQDRINQIKFLERIQGIVISENREEKLIEKFLNIITNSFPNDVVMFVNREKGSVYLPRDYSEKIDVNGLVNFDIFATSPKRSIPQLYNLLNSFVLPFVFSNGEVRGYLVVGSFSEGKFLKADEINIIDISSMLVKSKLEILANLRKIEKISKTDFLTGLPRVMSLCRMIKSYQCPLVLLTSRNPDTIFKNCLTYLIKGSIPLNLKVKGLLVSSTRSILFLLYFLSFSQMKKMVLCCILMAISCTQYFPLLVLQCRFGIYR